MRRRCRVAFFPAYRVQVLARCGDTASAREELDRIEVGARESRYIDPLIVATAYASLGDRTGTLRWLNDAIETNDWALFYLRWNPGFRALKKDPAFIELEHRARVL